MKCPHCQTEFFEAWSETKLSISNRARMDFGGGDYRALDPRAQVATCPSCLAPTVRLRIEDTGSPEAAPDVQVYPRGGAFPPPPPEIPQVIAQDYIEANEVLSISPKASAALSRRCLQAILSAHGYTGRDLMRQVEAVIAETDTTKALPTSLRESVDAIRNFGNFSAHPISDQTTLQVIDVEEGEAEWCVQLLLDMFDHYYVAPAKAAAKRAALAAKLAAAGKPPMKQ